MHSLVLYSLFFFIIIRTLGLLVSIDFYFSTRNSRFIAFITAWTAWIFAALFPILSDGVSNNTIISDIFLLINAIIAPLGSIFMIYGLFSYFIQIPKKLILILIIIVLLTPIITYIFLGKRPAFNLTLLFQSFFFIVAIFGPFLRLNSFKKQVGKSIRWYNGLILSIFIYLPISIIISLQGYNYGLYDVDNEIIITLNYLPPIATTIMIFIFLIHIEYNHGKILKNKMKDQYSHDLGNILQVLLGVSELLKLNEIVQDSEGDNIKLLKRKCKEASQLLNEIRKLE